MLIRVLGGICRFIIWLIALAAGITLFFLAVRSQVFQDLAFAKFYNFFEYPWFIRILPGLALFILAILAALPTILVPSKTSVMAFQSSSGPVSITRKAVQDFVVQLCQSEPGVREVLGVQVKEGGSGIDLAITLSIKEDHPMQMVATRCQERINSELGTSLGMERVGRVSVVVDKVGVSKTAPGKIPPLPQDSSFAGGGESPDSSESRFSDVDSRSL